MKNSLNKILNILMPVLAFIVIYLIFLILYYVKSNPLAFPHPLEIIKETVNLLKLSSTYLNILYSIARLLVCLFISFVISLVLSYLSYKYEAFKLFARPFITIFRTLPFISIIILIILMFSLQSACFITTILVIVPIIYEGLLNGFMHVDKSTIYAYKLDSKFNIKILFKIYIPLILADIKSTLRMTIGLGFKVLVTSEFISGKNYSIGYTLKDLYQNNIDMTGVYSQTFLLIILSLILTKLVNIIFKDK